VIDVRLIDGDALIDKYGDWYTEEGTEEGYIGTIKGIVDGMPTIEPERKTGYWHITDAYPHNVYCSECHKKYAQTHWAVWEDGSMPRRFCPNCGANMRGEQDE
jgi:hypothetical protein